MQASIFFGLECSTDAVECEFRGSWRNVSVLGVLKLLGIMRYTSRNKKMMIVRIVMIMILRIMNDLSIMHEIQKH